MKIAMFYDGWMMFHTRPGVRTRNLYPNGITASQAERAHYSGKKKRHASNYLVLTGGLPIHVPRFTPLCNTFLVSVLQ
jgi:hypothetical protein